IHWCKRAHWFSCNGNSNQSLPKWVFMKRKREISFRDSPLEIYSNPAVWMYKHVVFRLKISHIPVVTIEFEAIAIFTRRPVALRNQQACSPGNILLVDKNI